jgi:GTPase Era involved in 16S rRNA processing
MAKKTVQKPKNDTVTKKVNENSQSLILFERIKNLLEKQNKNVDWLSAELSIKSRSTLYVAFKKGSVSITMLNKIAEILKVQPFYFFENEIIDRFTEEVAKHSQNPDLKSFLMGFTRDVNKGMALEKATYKNIDPNGYNNGLML